MAGESTEHRTEIPPKPRGVQGPGSLSVHRAFVVHFATGPGRRRRFHGRVEHLSSGRTAIFSSLARLLGFVVAVLDGSVPSASLPPIGRERTINPPADAPSPTRRRGRTEPDGRAR